MDCAANYGHAKLIQLLIDCNAPIDPKDRSQVTIVTTTLWISNEELSCILFWVNFVQFIKLAKYLYMVLKVIPYPEVISLEVIPYICKPLLNF